MTISELRLKIKELTEKVNTKEVYTILLIIVVGFGSFGLGRLSKLQELKEPIRITDALVHVSSATAASALSSSGMGNMAKTLVPSGPPLAKSLGGQPHLPDALDRQAIGGQVVASKTGIRYHFPWCSGAQRISEANKMWFHSVEDARKAGYIPASNCKGLK